MPYSQSATTVRALGEDVVEQRAQGGVELAGRADWARGVGAGALEVVVEVREVDEGQVGVGARRRPGGWRRGSTGRRACPRPGPRR